MKDAPVSNLSQRQIRNRERQNGPTGSLACEQKHRSMIPEMYMMMDSTDFEEHVLLNALEDGHDDDHFNRHGDCSHAMDLTKQRPLSGKTLSSMSTTTVATALMDEEDIDGFFFDDCHSQDEGVEMVIDDEAKTPARVFEEKPQPSPDLPKMIMPPKSDRSSSFRKKSVSTSSPSKNSNNSDDGHFRVAIPGKFDVLCGQSRICASHTGNRRFQIVLDIFAPRYDAATSKQDKMTMTKEIVTSIQHAGGRFLKYRDGQWEEISDVTARDKASHALRTKVASWKRQQQEAKKEETSRRSSTAPSRSTHRRGGMQRIRRSSDSSIATSASDIVATSFDGNDSSSASVMSELMKAQKHIFATLTCPPVREAHPLKSRPDASS
jgi:hypothetical protein